MDEKPKLVGGNWKMNGTLESVKALTRGIAAQAGEISCDIVVFPASVYLQLVGSLIDDTDHLQIGAQNVNAAAKGAFTGEISVPMIAELGCRYALVGHSERRHLFGESNEVIAEKFAACVSAGIHPVLCVGETLEQRQAGETHAVIAEQLNAVLSHCGMAQLAGSVIAYEPVWAIGTGISAAPDEAEEVHKAISELLLAADSDIGTGIRIIYGGSVTPANAEELFSRNYIDGALVGGASLDADGFAEICRLAG